MGDAHGSGITNCEAKGLAQECTAPSSSAESTTNTKKSGDCWYPNTDAGCTAAGGFPNGSGDAHGSGITNCKSAALAQECTAPSAAANNEAGTLKKSGDCWYTNNAAGCAAAGGHHKGTGGAHASGITDCKKED